MNKGLPIFRNRMSNATDNKSFGSGLTAINEVSKRIAYITYDKMFSFCRWL